MRAARLFDELQVAHGDGSFARRLAQLTKLDLLDDHIDTRSTLITSQLPVKAWHTYLNDRRWPMWLTTITLAG